MYSIVIPFSNSRKSIHCDKRNEKTNSSVSIYLDYWEDVRMRLTLPSLQHVFEQQQTFGRTRELHRSKFRVRRLRWSTTTILQRSLVHSYSLRADSISRSLRKKEKRERRTLTHSIRFAEEIEVTLSSSLTFIDDPLSVKVIIVSDVIVCVDVRAGISTSP